jgi:microsomal dipeptidase-like Zn-dependent dipeptidase
MIKKIVRYLLVLLVLFLVIFFFLIGKYVDWSRNKTETVENFEASSEAQQIHQQLMVADLHSDILLWDRNLLSDNLYGHSDLPKLLSGNYALQIFDAVIKTPEDLNYESNSDDSDNITLLAMANRWPPRTWFNLTERAIYQSEKLKKAALSSSSLEIIYTWDDLDYFLKLRRNNSYLVGGLLSLEGLHALEGDLQNLEKLVQAGFRMMGLVHFFDNEVGGSSSGENKGGLTDFGRQVIREMEKRSIIIDLAHASDTLIDEVLKLAERPVVVSHTGVDGIYDSNRNLSDRQLRAIAANGGLIGIGFWEEAAGDLHPRAIARSIRYAVNIAGIDHVALGSDFDGAVTVPIDASQSVLITEALLQEGFSREEIKKIMGENLLQFLMDNLPE